MGNQIKIKIQRTKGNDDLPLPKYMTSGSSGMDLFSAVNNPVIIQPKEFCLIPLGIKIAMPEGYEAQIRPRSGLSAQYGIGLLNSPGTIDSDYRGEIKVILFNFGDKPFVVNRGDRIAQMVISPMVKADLVECDDLDDTIRGDGGFGHTGIRDSKS
ncbi:MAG: dUTP diphosphatase [Candidatus Poribacteria bacterium]